jgi:cyclohexa-1,5-dienecarbonyl-CoA hydratase
MGKIRAESLWSGAGRKVVLDAPKANVLDAEMMGQIHAELDALRQAPSVKLLVFEGAGPHFSFGASVEEHTKDRAGAMLESFHGLFLKMIDLAIPTAAVVRGQCLGGGMELAIFCNWIFAAPDAKLGQPEIQLGVLPPPASLILPRKVGQAAADELCLTGASVSAERARDLGLVTEVADDPAAACAAFAEKHILPKSASSLRMAVRAARLEMNEALRRGLPVVQMLYLAELMETEDANEGIGSFLEKRKPVWKDR